MGRLRAHCGLCRWVCKDSHRARGKMFHCSNLEMPNKPQCIEKETFPFGPGKRSLAKDCRHVRMDRDARTVPMVKGEVGRLPIDLPIRRVTSARLVVRSDQFLHSRTGWDRKGQPFPVAPEGANGRIRSQIDRRRKFRT
jgi:hypothetical protein